MPASERFDTVVIGAGQAGLATSYRLAENKVDHVVLDAGSRIGHSWRDRWDSLRLFTAGRLNNLPGMPFPGPRSHFPSKDEVAEYLEAYARKFSLPVRLGIAVDRLERAGERLAITAGDRRFEADNVVVATGPFQRPRTPAWARDLAPAIRQLHSSEYRNPSQLTDGDTLVVGAATSGCEIAMDVARAGRRVHMAGNDVPSIPPIARRTILPWVATRTKTHFLGKKIHAKAKSGAGHPLIGFSYKKVLRTGVARVPRVAGVEGGKPRLEDGRVLEVGNVILCTGFRIDFSWIDLPIFEPDGYPRHELGVVPEQPGLFFVGLMFLHSLSSQLVLGVDRDTRHVAEALVRRAGSPRTSPIIAAEPKAAT
jgi:putative flavoprotein involved in K+ transport